MIRERRGTALLVVLALTVLVASLTAIGVTAAGTRARLASDRRSHLEGELVAASALATVRVAHRGELDTLSDGGAFVVPVTMRTDGWSWSAAIVRNGALIVISVVARRGVPGGPTAGASRAQLLLYRSPADTVRVLAHRAQS